MLLPDVIRALRRGVRTAIPSSIRRKVLMPIVALCPRNPTTRATRRGDTRRDPK